MIHKSIESTTLAWGSNVAKKKSIANNSKYLSLEVLGSWDPKFTERKKKIATRLSLLRSSQLVLKGQLMFLIFYFLPIKCFPPIRSEVIGSVSFEISIEGCCPSREVVKKTANKNVFLLRMDRTESHSWQVLYF